MRLGVLFARLALGLLLLWAGLTKLAATREFYLDLLAYRLPLPDSLLRLTAAVFPWLELLVGAGLLANRWREVFRPLAVAITALFVLALGQALVRGLDISCGCFGRPLFAWAATPGFALARALLLLSAALFLHFSTTDKTTKSSS
ncbi:DoxX family protein [Opitutaceae bacterium TAV5]|nr:DoxX family protein [Opitutaceae bacterium TAV5]